jgi:hypothetical protein
VLPSFVIVADLLAGLGPVVRALKDTAAGVTTMTGEVAIVKVTAIVRGEFVAAGSITDTEAL